MENKSTLNKKSHRIHTAIQVEYEKSGIIIILPRDYNPTVDRVSDESILERQLLRTLNLKGQLSRNEFDNFCSCCFGLINMNEKTYEMSVNPDGNNGTQVHIKFAILTGCGIKILAGSISMKEISEMVIPVGNTPGAGIIRYEP